MKGFDEKKITEQIIIEYLNELQSTAITKQKYADYYNDQHAILKNYAMQESRSDQKLIFNFPRKFVDNEVELPYSFNERTLIHWIQQVKYC